MMRVRGKVARELDGAAIEHRAIGRECDEQGPVRLLDDAYRRAMLSAMCFAILAHSPGGRLWPMPSMSTRFESGMAAAVARPPLGSTSVSARPCSTSVGIERARSRAVRSPE